jgi:hypothetical protein
VKRGKTITENGLTVKTSGIAFIPTPIIRRIKRGKEFHIIITVGLGKDGSGSDREVKCIAMWYGSMSDAGVRSEMGTVDEEMLWRKRQEGDSTVHG